MNARDKDGETALHNAVRTKSSTVDNKASVVFSLLAHKADPILQDHSGRNSMHYAQLQGTAGILSLLRDVLAEPAGGITGRIVRKM